MKIHDLNHKDGSRSIQLKTKCGYEIVLMRTVDNDIKQACFFDHSPVCLFNSHYRLSLAGAKEYAEALGNLINQKE